jgi:hypothetical protein
METKMLEFWGTLLVVMAIAAAILFPISMWFSEMLTHEPSYFRQWILRRLFISDHGPPGPSDGLLLSALSGFASIGLTVSNPSGNAAIARAPVALEPTVSAMQAADVVVDVDWPGWLSAFNGMPILSHVQDLALESYAAPAANDAAQCGLLRLSVTAGSAPAIANNSF